MPLSGRPRGVTALALFFAFGAGVSFVSLVALALPGGPLEPMWRLNPRAREQFATMGVWGPLLMAVVSLACGLALVGLWRGRRWGYLTAATMLVVSLAGDLANALSGLEPRAWFGVPIAGAMLLYLATRRVREFFARP